MVGEFGGAEPRETRDRSPHCLQSGGGRGSGEVLMREHPVLGEAEESCRKVPCSPHQESAHNLPTVTVDYKVVQDPKSLISGSKRSFEFLLMERCSP